MKACCGKVHEYLSMTLNFSTPGEVKLMMLPYIKEIIALFQKYDNTDRVMKTPAAQHLFQVREDAIALSEEETAIFHHFVAKSLFATKCAHPDISVAVAFLLMHVQGPNEDDWKN